MKFFDGFKSLSIKNTVESVGAMIARFPFVIALTVVGTCLALYLFDLGLPDHVQAYTHVKILLLCILGLPFLVALALLSEQLSMKKVWSLGLQVLGIGLLAVYYFFLPQSLDQFLPQDTITLILLNAISYLSILFIPFLNKKSKENNIGQWKYIETLFVRLFVTGVFSLTLFAGLSLSLWSIDYLFSVKWEGSIYLQVWALVVGIFGSWFYLSGFPQSPQAMHKDFSYPRVLHIFVQYILVPLICLFYIILYVYTGKIVLTWTWPLGGTANWILVFSIVGVLAYLIGFPMQSENKSVWLKKFFSTFFALILPLTIVLFMAIGIRIHEYGVTEDRYLVVLFGVWLVVLAIYYLLSKKKHIIFAPMVTAIAFLIALFGPLNMFSVSFNSQYHRLETLLVQNNVLVNGKIQKIQDESTFDRKTAENIQSKVFYLVDHGQAYRIQPWFSEQLEDKGVGAIKNIYETQRKAMQEIGLKDEYGGYNSQYFYFSQYRDFSGAITFPALSTEGYAYVITTFDMSKNPSPMTPRDILLGERKIRVSFLSNNLIFTENDRLVAQFNFAPFVQTLVDKYGYQSHESIKFEDFGLVLENDQAKVKIQFNRLSGDTVGGNLNITDFGGTLFFSLK